ncbi:hypothetical protein [Bradyrhizobium ottawaense]|nr:hypothetical protein [Bradyrhizobium ottawaense]
MTTKTRRKFRRSTSTLADLFDTRLDDSIILADMRERVRLFGTTSLRFA